MRTLNSLSMQALYGSDKGNGLSAWQFWPWRMWRDRRRRAIRWEKMVWHCQRVEIIDGSVFQARLA
ncbi:MAG: hypothetical protein U0938_02095 [Thiobacillus sp.]|nr:hypothetical protein [Thiobacillus sp.]